MADVPSTKPSPPPNGGPNLPDGSINTNELADAAVTTPKLADAAVTDVKIVSVDFTKITNIPSPAGGGIEAGDIAASFTDLCDLFDALAAVAIPVLQAKRAQSIVDRIRARWVPAEGGSNARRERID